MKRRDFIALLGGATAVWPFAARAQQGERVRRLGVLMGVSENHLEAPAWLSIFVKRLAALGWNESRNLQIDTRWGAGDASRIGGHAAELVRQTPDVILGQGTLAMSALYRQTRSIPIVAVQVIDPVAGGFVASLAHPGGNITGFTNFEDTIGGKWLETLKEIAPDLEQVLVMLNPANSAHAGLQRTIETTGLRSGIRTINVAILSADEIERSINRSSPSKAGLIVLPDAVTVAHGALIITVAAQHRLPAVYPLRYFTAAGGLMSYAPDQGHFFSNAASYVDRILRGADPATLPVQAPTKFELVINLKTAKSLGLVVPPMLLARADEVIE
jgi:putative ABC transport system substrate-binding protein